MTSITNIEEARSYIENFTAEKSKISSQDVLFDHLTACEQLAIRYNENKLLIRSRIYLTDFYIQSNEIQKALSVALENKSLAENENLEEEQLNCYSGLLNIYHQLGDYSSIEEIIFIYREKLLNSNNYSKLCSLYIISAIQYHSLKDYKKCIEANEKALEYALKINNIPLLIHIYNNYGAHALSYDLNLSEDLLTKSLNLIKESDNDNLYSIAVVNINLADLYTLKNDYKICNKCLDTSIRISKSINNKNLLLESENKLCELFIKTKRYVAAKKILLRNEQECIESNNKHALLNIYSSLHVLFNEIKDYQYAYGYLIKYQQLKDEIFNEESAQKIKNLQITNEVKDIKLQRDQAEKLAHLKHDFLANMSHEIRTPINSVLGICYLLQQDEISEKQSNYIHRLERAGENLLGLINEILDLSKIEAGKLELVNSSFSFNTVLSDTVQSLQHKADEKNIELIVETTEELNHLITGDIQRLTQVLINLIANAIKFTNKGFVKIKTQVLNSVSDNTVLINCSVEDTGTGIPEDKIVAVFERYEQAAATIKTQFGGTGLGLAISKKLVELMNGKIEVKSRLDKGSIFTITIPFGATHFETIKIHAEETVDTAFLTNCDIIVADDMDESRYLLKNILQHFNSTIQIREAANGKEVIDLIEQKVPDVLLIDLDMPILNGFDTVVEIHKMKLTSNIRIIAHTASLLTMNADEIFSLGFDALLLKPFKPKELLQKLMPIK